jgi:hypothetical protein
VVAVVPAERLTQGAQDPIEELARRHWPDPLLHLHLYLWVDSAANLRLTPRAGAQPPTLAVLPLGFPLDLIHGRHARN